MRLVHSLQGMNVVVMINDKRDLMVNGHDTKDMCTLYIRDASAGWLEYIFIIKVHMYYISCLTMLAALFNVTFLLKAWYVTTTSSNFSHIDVLHKRHFWVYSIDTLVGLFLNIPKYFIQNI